MNDGSLASNCYMKLYKAKTKELVFKRSFYGDWYDDTTIQVDMFYACGGGSSHHQELIDIHSGKRLESLHEGEWESSCSEKEPNCQVAAESIIVYKNYTLGISQEVNYIHKSDSPRKIIFKKQQITIEEPGFTALDKRTFKENRLCFKNEKRKYCIHRNRKIRRM
ncbi:MAG: hypothetical protein AAF518_09010 [Spirochaetota bacterium]